MQATEQRRIRRWLPWLLSLTLLGGCGGQRLVREDDYLKPAAPVTRSTLPAPVLGGILVVEPLSAQAIYHGRALVRARTPRALVLRRDRYRFWVDEPARLLQGRLVRYLQAVGVARQVTWPQPEIDPDFALRGQVLGFDAVMQDGRLQGVRVALRVTLVRVASSELLLDRRFEYYQAAGAGASLPVLFGQALDHLGRQLVQGIRTRRLARRTD